MTPFVLIALMQTPAGPVAYAMQTGIAGADCVAALVDLAPLMAPGVALACELDRAGAKQ